MSNSGPASLDSSLLARKGSATPAIPDESPLVLHLDEHRPESHAAEDVQREEGPETGAEQPVAESGQRRASGWWSRLSARVRWAAIAVLIAIIGAIAWLLSQSAAPVPVAENPATVATPAEVDAPGAEQSTGLNLVTPGDVAAAEAPEGDRGGSSEAAVPLPTSAAVAITKPSVSAAGDAGLGLPGEKSEAAAAKRDSVAGTLLPVNVPPGDGPAAGDGADPAPIIEAAIPKSVSPVPLPKAKPRPAAAANGRYAIQLASVGVEKRATEEAFRLQKQFADVLGGRTIQVESAQIEGRGTMYRLRAEGYQTLAEARAACAQIEQLKGSCLALRR